MPATWVRLPLVSSTIRCARARRVESASTVRCVTRSALHTAPPGSGCGHRRPSGAAATRGGADPWRRLPSPGTPPQTAQEPRNATPWRRHAVIHGMRQLKRHAPSSSAKHTGQNVEPASQTHAAWAVARVPAIGLSLASPVRSKASWSYDDNCILSISTGTRPRIAETRCTSSGARLTPNRPGHLPRSSRSPKWLPIAARVTPCCAARRVR
jgi:hypothetical protein